MATTGSGTSCWRTGSSTGSSTGSWRTSPTRSRTSPTPACRCSAAATRSSRSCSTARRSSRATRSEPGCASIPSRLPLLDGARPPQGRRLAPPRLACVRGRADRRPRLAAMGHQVQYVLRHIAQRARRGGGGMSGLLDGIRVLDLSRLLPGGFGDGPSRRPRRGGDQGRAAGRRRLHALARAEARRRVGCELGRRSRQALDRRRPQEPPRRRGRAAARPLRGRVRRELPAGRRRPARRRLRGAPGRAARARLLLDLRLRPDRPAPHSRQGTT